MKSQGTETFGALILGERGRRWGGIDEVHSCPIPPTSPSRVLQPTHGCDHTRTRRVTLPSQLISSSSRLGGRQRSFTFQEIRTSVRCQAISNSSHLPSSFYNAGGSTWPGGGKAIQVTLPRCPILTYNHTITANLHAPGTNLDFMRLVWPALLR